MATATAVAPVTALPAAVSVVPASSSSAAATPQAQAQSKNRKRKAADSDGDEKPRGRPRKNSKDESAAERRRTQIRLAQRAYRQRKETTIDELRQRVTELTGTVEMMDRGLRDFTTTARQRGLPSQTLTDLDALLQQFAPFIANVRSPPKSTAQPETDEVVQNISAVAVDPMRGIYRETPEVAPKTPHVPVTLGYSMMLDNNMGLEHQEMLPPNASHRQPGYVVGEEQYEEQHPQHQHQHQQQPPHTPHHHRTPPPPPVQHAQQHQQQHQHQHQHQQQRQQQQQQTHHRQAAEMQQRFLQEQKPQLSMLNTGLYTSTVMAQSRTVTPIAANCNYEKSFARRLQRICIEGGFQLLMDPSKAPNAFQRIFRLHLSTGRDRNDVMHRFALAIKRDINDNLDSDVSPFSYIGGAGLHYPDTAGCRRPETGSEEDRVALDVMASSIPGLGGEWLDTNDVQGYLHERGIKVDGSAMYIHASLPVEFLSTPPEHVEVDEFLSQVSRYHNFEDVEEFHTRFAHLDDQIISRSPMSPPRVPGPAVPESFHMSTLNNMWNPASVSNIELGSLTDLMTTPAPHFFSIPGTASYDAMQEFMHPPAASQHQMPTSHRSSSSTAGSADGSTFSPPVGESDSVSSVDPEEAFEQGFHPHHGHTTARSHPYPTATPIKHAAMPPATAVPHVSRAGPQAFTPVSAGPQSPGNTLNNRTRPNPAPSGERVTVTIDVCKLLKIMLQSSVCLGRAPGFRRWHVDAAIRTSIMTGF